MAEGSQLNVFSSARAANPSLGTRSEKDAPAAVTLSSTVFSSVHQASLKNTTINATTGQNVTVNNFFSSQTNASTEPRSDRNANNITGHTPRAEFEIYVDHLLCKKRGLPLWVPGPSMSFPTEYRKKGISIGDVGIINRTGEFSFLFNVFFPPTHPINKGRVPVGFSPIKYSDIKNDVETNVVFGPNNYLASSSVRRSRNVDSSGLMFKMFAKEGAILMMPEGATSHDLRNKRVLERYVAKNIRHWYEYAIVERGRSDVENGDIRLVVGCDKVSFWGIATFASAVEEKVSFEFKSGNGNTAVRDYVWDSHIGTGNGRVGPQEVEIRDLRTDAESPLQNQCVFVRTMNMNFSEKAWREVAACKVRLDEDGLSEFMSSDYVLHGESSKTGSASGGTSTPALHITSMQFGLSIMHPSTSLNKYLIGKSPNASMVITQDADWISAIQEDDITLPNPDELCARILTSHELCEEDGIVTIRTKDHSTEVRPSSPHNAEIRVPQIQVQIQAPQVQPPAPYYPTPPATSPRFNLPLRYRDPTPWSMAASRSPIMARGSAGPQIVLDDDDEDSEED